ncbi:dihydrolipoamide acetyltransferase family protein [Nonomuraea roseoviolacea]|uniref:Dihydrolipoamide acetyltransferase component of pyruvate dehydrogenase complex n=1 Tax=Nonomuraea roseoviolacea subsp. carminata TaxID=160689 RepID=A0ABT1K1T0_9ACTN|nr:dihydrolipoamide acetyltransferase family protein [Nonomuraea roseoviolacea]MCP2347953.1 pyruvate dehydrogenase E2 component (dihydrolipoamide acetyltransferase) [Nonomuraea roseoviolacea subsp. carminata]
MRREFKLPDVGEGLTEAEIVRWHVKEGDAVKVNQIVVEIETAKSIVELPIPWDGVVAGLMAEAGQTVDVGVAIIAVDTAEEGGAPAQGPAGQAASGADEAPGRGEALADDMVPRPPAEGAVEPGVHGSPAPKEERQAVLVGYGVKTGATKRRPRKSSPATTPAAQAAPTRPPVVLPAPAATPGRVAVLAKPPVRKLARDLGVDLTTLTGSGPQGTITRDDVHAAARSSQPAAPAGERATTRTAGREERIPIKGVRKMTAQAMVASAFTAPHVTEFLQVDVTETMAAVRRLRELPDFAEVKVSPLLLVAKAVLVAARRHPMINSAWDEQAQEIVVKHYVNLGIAAATPRGLVVPNVKDAHELPLPELARRLTELAETARAGRAQPADMAGGTFTITNVGVFGVDAGTPILNPGEAAILAFGQVRDMPWVVDGELAVRKVTTLALSFDHRIVDGEQGSLFLRDVGAMLEDPLRMLAWN